MTEAFEIEALEFLHDQMSADRRAAFQQRLDRDPVATADLKTCADALAQFACDTAPAEPMTASDQRGALAAILAATSEVRPQNFTPPPGKIIPWARYFWPLAAALLLAMNLIQFERPLRPAIANSAGTRAAPDDGRATQFADGSSIVALDGKLSPGAVGDAGATSRRSAMPQVAAAAKRGDELRKFEKLRSDYAELQRSTAALRAQYETVIRSISGGVGIDAQAGRIAAMELVDSGSYARGERKGLLDVARGILAEPGVVVAAMPPPAQSGTGGAGLTFEPSSPAEPGSGAASPYAWAVFDDKENRGYLNLYNLPTVPADQSLQLWVKAPDAATYQRVGEVPGQFQGGNGSLYYNLPPETSAPTEILITQESRAASPSEPAGPVVLRGP